MQERAARPVSGSEQVRGTWDVEGTRDEVREVSGLVNRLAERMSPYLRQHASNPVDWWPWGPEAFDEARRCDVPVLLSVGYAACHWCHEVAA